MELILTLICMFTAALFRYRREGRMVMAVSYAGGTAVLFGAAIARGYFFRLLFFWFLCSALSVAAAVFYHKKYSRSGEGIDTLQMIALQSIKMTIGWPGFWADRVKSILFPSPGD